jgi:hypothetical protein
MARKQNGSVVGDNKRGFYNIVNVVLASTIGVMPETISSIGLMFYQKRINTKNLFHMLRRMKQ